MTVERDLALEWRRQYEDGATVEQIALDAYVSPCKVRRALHSVGTPMRAAHTRKGTKRNTPATTVDGIEGAKEPRVHKIKQLASYPRPAHRRRGRRL